VNGEFLSNRLNNVENDPEGIENAIKEHIK
jgi:hypothetical protein